MALTPYEFLDRKRRGVPLEAGEIAGFIRAFVDGRVADYQMAAFLMAAAIHGLAPSETAALTRTMLESGEQWKLRDRYDFVADKHSTGGVGDKISLVLAPLVAACDSRMAMLSGRGLGHTGGTLDKLDAVPGFDARLSQARLLDVLDRTGCVIATSTEAVAPADRRMYALRDVTGTVESIPLITASIMSKKLALGASALVLDVKFGSGAFMKTIDEARDLARSLIAAAEGSGTRVEALLSSMNTPLGEAIGNANEAAEAFAVLRGEGPGDVRDLSISQAELVLMMQGRDRAVARRTIEDAIASGRAVTAAEKWIEAQGGDPGTVTDPSLLPQPHRRTMLTAPRSGYIGTMDVREIGMALIALGGGREKKDDSLDYAAGLRILVRRGERVEVGQPLVEVAYGSRTAEVHAKLESAIPIIDEAPAAEPLIAELIS